MIKYALFNDFHLLHQRNINVFVKALQSFASRNALLWNVLPIEVPTVPIELILSQCSKTVEA